MKASLKILIFILVLLNTVRAQHTSTTKIRAFKAGEILEYDVYYNWGLIWVDAGWVTFSVAEKIIGEKSLFHFIGEGESKHNWDWFYKVRDKYQSYNDSSNLRPIRYIRNSHDGSD